MSQPGFNAPNPHPWNWAQPYNPGISMGFDPGNFGGLAAQLMTPYLMQFAGPTNFLPYQNPAQAVTDQLAMRQYFNNTQANTFGMARMGTGRVAAGIAGMMSIGSNGPLTDLNRQQAHTITGFANNPYIKTAIGQMVGPENLEAAMFGSRGDPSMIGAAANRIGYYRPDPATGARRMSGQSLEDFSRGVYASLYEPAGNLEELAAGARSGDHDATVKLKKAAKAEHENIVSDDDLTRRIADMGAEAVGKIYNKYQPGGEARSVEEQARELTKFDRAIKETGVLAQNETSVGSLQRRAERSAAESAHGFMAGQTSQVMEHLFQRGMLPQSIGALSAADRVKILAEQEPDKETMTRLSRQFGHRDLLENNEEYAAAVRSGNQAKQDELLDARMPDYERRVGNSLNQIKERQKKGGPIQAEEAERLLAMDGMDSMASNVDAGRAAGAVKKHTEALAAIRQIFGDSGNPNAPVPALLAALDHLSQGASARMSNSSKVASTLREMRGMAKEMGMGFDQMAGMATAIGAYGDQIGLAGETKVEAQANAMALVNRMRKDGAFANQGFGALSEPEAAQKAAALAVRTEGSVVSKGAAAIRRAYATNKEKYEGTELGEIAKRMEDPNWDGSYEWEGKKKNFYTEAGEGGMREMSRIASASNMSPTQMQTLMKDFQTQEYQQDAAGLKAAKADMMRLISNRATAGTISAGAQKNPGSKLNENTEEARKARNAVATRLTESIVDSSDMTESEQLDHLEKTLEADFAATLEAQGYTAEEAKQEAKAIMDSTFGTDPEERRAKLQETASRVNVSIEQTTRGEYRSARQLRGVLKGTQGLGEERAEQKRRADMEHRVGSMYQGTPMMRGSDYLAEIGASGEAFNFDQFLEATFGIKPNSELRDKLAPELAGAFAAAQQQIADSTVNDAYLRDLAAGKATDLRGNAITGARAEAELRNLATRGLTDEQKADFNKRFSSQVGDDVIAERRAAKLSGMTDKDLDKLYTDTFDADGLATATTREEKLKQLQGRIQAGTDVAGLRTEDLLEEGEYTQEQMINMARQQSGGGARDEGMMAEHEARRKRGRARFTGLFGRTKAEIDTGLRAALVDDAKEGGFDVSDNIDKFMQLGMYKTGDEEADKKFEAALKESGLTEEQQKRVRQTFGDFRAARDAAVGDYVDPEHSADKPGTTESGEKRAATEKAGAASAKDAAPSDATPPGKTDTASAETKAKRDAAPDGKPAADAFSALTAEAAKLTETLKSLEEPFRNLIDAAAGPAERAVARADGMTRDERAQMENTRAERRAPVVQQRSVAAAGSGGGGGSIKGTLTLIGLQSALLAARGSPVFTPTGDGPSIVPGNPAHGAYLSSSAVSPVAEA